MTSIHTDQESPLLTGAEIVVTVLFWGLWLYLIMPLISLLLWFAGVYIFVDQMVTLGGYQSFIDTLYHYSLVVLAIMLTTFLWVWWNARRYGSVRNKRTLQPDSVSIAELAATADTTEDVIVALQSRRQVLVDFNDKLGLILKS